MYIAIILYPKGRCTYCNTYIPIILLTFIQSAILHYYCATDDSGRWGKGGLFDALSARSTQPQLCYELAGKMRDLTLGDAHLIPIDDLQSREKGRDMVRINFSF